MGFLILGAGGARAGSVPQNASDTQNSCHGAWRWAQCPLLDPFFGAPFMLLTKPAAWQFRSGVGRHPHPQQTTSWKTAWGGVLGTAQAVMVHDTRHAKELFYNAIWMQRLFLS